MEILILNGPNLNLVGERNKKHYGSESLTDFFDAIQQTNFNLTVLQSNNEGELIDILQTSNVDAIIFNAGGYTHTSVALRDAVEAISTPVVEVHISNIAARESFRHNSLLTPVAVGCIFGFGLKGYLLAIDYVLKYLKD